MRSTTQLLPLKRVIPQQNLESDAGIGIAEIVRFLHESYRLILLWIIVAVSIAAAYIAITPPSYTARAQVLVETGRWPIVFADTPQPEVSTDQVRAESQIEIMKSDPIALAVVRELGLARNPALGERGKSIVARAVSWLNSSADAADDDPDAEDYVASLLSDDLSVRRIGQSMVIEIAFTSTSPTLAASVANAVTQAYLKQDIEAKSHFAQRLSAWLSNRLAELQQQSYEASRALEQYRIAGGEGPVVDTRAKLAELESAAQSYRRIYDGFLGQYTESVQKATYPEAGSRVVAAATPPLGKSHPKSGLILAFAIAVGSASGGLAAMARRTVDRRVTSPRNLVFGHRSLYIGAVTSLHARRGMIRRIFPFLRSKIDSAKSAAATLAMLRDPSSPLAIDLRDIRLAINARMPQDEHHCVGIVGNASGDGATSLAAGLACTYARAGSRTLLINTAGHSPLMRHVLGAKTGSILAPYGKQPEPTPNEPRDMAPAQVLTLARAEAESWRATAGMLSMRLGHEIQNLQARFDVILVDLPPLNAAADARELAPQLDGILVVAPFETATTASIEASMSSIDAIGARCIGVVLNRVPGMLRQRWRATMLG